MSKVGETGMSVLQSAPSTTYLNMRCVRKGKSMKVIIYVQPDRETALVIPINSISKTLPPAQEAMRKAAIKTVKADLDDSIIGLDRNVVKQRIGKDGWFVNKAHIQLEEHE